MMGWQRAAIQGAIQRAGMNQTAIPGALPETKRRPLARANDDPRLPVIIGTGGCQWWHDCDSCPFDDCIASSKAIDRHTRPENRPPGKKRRHLEWTARAVANVRAGMDYREAVRLEGYGPRTAHRFRVETLVTEGLAEPISGRGRVSAWQMQAERLVEQGVPWREAGIQAGARAYTTLLQWYHRRLEPMGVPFDRQPIPAEFPKAVEHARRVARAARRQRQEAHADS